MADITFTPDDYENEWAGTDRSGFGRYEWSGNRRVYRVVGPWSTHTDALKAILGHAELDAARPPTLKRFKPWTCPDDGNLVAVAADLRGVQYAGQNIDPDDIDPATERMRTANKYTQIELAVTFASVRHKFGGVVDFDTMEEAAPTSETERYCVKRVRRAQDVVQGLVGEFTWGPNNDPVSHNIPIVFGYQEVDVTWLAVPALAVPVTAIDECLRSVNNKDLTLPDFPPPAVYPKGAVLLRAVSEEEMYFHDSSPGVHLTYHFNVLMGFEGEPDGGTGWNYFPRQSPADTWWRLTRKGMTPGTPNSGRYPEADFSKLFKPEP